MITGETWGLIGGIAGGLIGLIGGLIGTYCSIRNTKNSQERSYVIKFTLFIFVLVTSFLGLMWLLPNPYRNFLWAPYSILLVCMIQSLNRKLHGLRSEKEAEQAAPRNR
jgi:O-antigen/teichoic acid export membrane protein